MSFRSSSTGPAPVEKRLTSYMPRPRLRQTLAPSTGPVGRCNASFLTAHLNTAHLKKRGGYLVQPARSTRKLRCGFTGTDTVTFKANDGKEDSEDATVTIVITNDKPEALNDFFAINHNETLTIDSSDLLGNDLQVDGDSLTLVDPANIQLAGLTYDEDEGTFTFDPGSSSGMVSFDHTVTDGLANDTVTISGGNEISPIFV